MAITAPFQFTRIPRAVWFPDWGKWVSHDVPFKDGYSGTIDIAIEAMTPLLIGGERRGAKADVAGEVWPVRLPNGTYAIPGSSLQGMIRNILEIACFGKLGPWVEKRRFGVRDIGRGATADALYKSRISSGGNGITIIPKTKTGWLIRSEGKTGITPCDMSRIQHTEIEMLKIATSHVDLLKILSRSDPYHDKSHTSQTKDAPARYEAFLGNNGSNKQDLAVCVTLDAADANGQKLDHEHSCGKIRYRLCVAKGTSKGTLVLTGKTQGADKWDQEQKKLVSAKHTKHLEFVFHGPDRDSATATDPNHILIDDHVWRDFKLIHSPPKGSGQKENLNWTYWKGDFEAGKPVPIFYIEAVNSKGVTDPKMIEAMGTAFMFKLAHKNDTHQMLDNSSAFHCDRDRYDLPSLIFGGIGDESGDTWYNHSLKRRASFDWAKATLPAGEQGPKCSNPTVLLSPKPSYYPIYVRQPAPVGSLYASYTPAKRRANDVGDVALARYYPELSGVKVWPSPIDHSVNIRSLPGLPQGAGNQGAGNSVAVKLNLLPEKTTFSTKLHVHNLRKVELGALLWALTLGDKAALTGGTSAKRHRIGMGKPYGMGSVRMKVNAPRLVANTDGESIDTESIMDAFVDYMDKLLPALASASDPRREWKWVGAGQPAEMKWTDTLQVKGLVEAATCKGPAEHSRTYMPLNGPTGYTDRRKASDELPPFKSNSWELSRVEDATNVPVDAPPTQHGGGNNNGNNLGGNHWQQHQPPVQTIPAEVGCPVAHSDGRQGEISRIQYGLCYIRTDVGTVENWPTNSFTVTGPPDL